MGTETMRQAGSSLSAPGTCATVTGGVTIRLAQLAAVLRLAHCTGSSRRDDAISAQMTARDGFNRARDLPS